MLSGNLGLSENYLWGNSDGVCIAAGSDKWRTNGASLSLNNKNRSSNPGAFNLSASDGVNVNSTTGELLGTASGQLLWNNKHVVRSVNNTNADANGNVKITIVNPPIYIVEQTVNNSGWYRKYNNGFIEQAGWISLYRSNTVITMSHAFKDTNYMLLFSFGGKSERDQAGAAGNKTTTSFTITHAAVLNNEFGVYWYASGY